MNKRLLIGIIVAVVILAGGAATYFYLNKEDSANESTAQTSQTGASFDPAATANVSFTATITGKNATQTYTANLEHDGKGASKYTGSNGDTPFEMYLINNEYITCSGGTCFKMSSLAGSPINENNYSFSAEDIEAFRASSTYKGQAPCPAGTCDLWQTTKDGQTMDILVASDKKISKASGTSGDTNYEIIFTYKDVTITPPTNVQELPR